MAEEAPNLTEPGGSNSEILLYQTEDKRTQIDVRLEGETVWLNQSQMVELFQTTKQNISLHIRNLFEEGELQEATVVKEYLTTAADGKRYSVQHYNLDVIISVGYRVKSHRGTRCFQALTEMWRCGAGLRCLTLINYVRRGRAESEKWGRPRDTFRKSRPVGGITVTC